MNTEPPEGKHSLMFLRLSGCALDSHLHVYFNGMDGEREGGEEKRGERGVRHGAKSKADGLYRGTTPSCRKVSALFSIRPYV